MAKGQNIRKLIGTVFLGKKIKVAALTETEKEDLKNRILLTISQFEGSNT